MHVRDAMTPTVLTIGPAHTLRQAAKQMRARHVGAAVVLDPEADGPGILTERDVLDAVAADQDPDRELAADHLTPDAVVATPDWPLTDAAAAMLAGGFRHLVVCDAGEVVGVLSVRDLLRVWSGRPSRRRPLRASSYAALEAGCSRAEDRRVSVPVQRAPSLAGLHALIGTINADLDLGRTLDAVCAGVVEGLGFEVAVVNLLRPDGDYDVVAVEGSAQAREALLGQRGSGAEWDAWTAVCTPVGKLLVDYRRVAEDDEVPTWVPDTPVPAEDDDAWHPLDAVLAPLWSSASGPLGMLSVDLPRDGRRPGRPSSSCWRCTRRRPRSPSRTPGCTPSSSPTTPRRPRWSAACGRWSTRRRSPSSSSTATAWCAPGTRPPSRSSAGRRPRCWAGATRPRRPGGTTTASR